MSKDKTPEEIEIDRLKAKLTAAHHPRAQVNLRYRLACAEATTSSARKKALEAFAAGNAALDAPPEPEAVAS